MRLMTKPVLPLLMALLLTALPARSAPGAPPVQVVEYDAGTQTITTRGKGRSLVMTVGSQQAEIEGRAVAFDLPPYVVEERLMLPLRFAAESRRQVQMTAEEIYGDEFTADNPADLVWLDRIAEAWNRAIPAAHPWSRMPPAGWGFSGISLLLDSGNASARFAPLCRSRFDCTVGADSGLVELQVGDGPVLVYAPELAKLMAELPMKKQ